MRKMGVTLETSPGADDEKKLSFEGKQTTQQTRESERAKDEVDYFI